VSVQSSDIHTPETGRTERVTKALVEGAVAGFVEDSYEAQHDTASETGEVHVTSIGFSESSGKEEEDEALGAGLKPTWQTIPEKPFLIPKLCI